MALFDALRVIYFVIVLAQRWFNVSRNLTHIHVFCMFVTFFHT